MTTCAPIVIVGAGAAGATTARTLLARDPEVRVVLIGEEPDLPYDRTQLSKSVLSGDRDLPAPLYPTELHDERLELITGSPVTSIDRTAQQVNLADGSQRAYRALVLACGAAPRTLHLPGHDLPGVHVVRTREGSAELRAAVEHAERLVVIGGGLIGLEVAAAARSHATAVTIIETADQLLGRVLPRQVAEVVAATHREHAVDLQLGVGPVAITGSERVTGVELSDGRSIPTDAVVIAVGARPRTELAAAAGLTVDDGVVVDAQLRTEDPSIWAVGDVVRRRDQLTGPAGLRTEAWTPALAMGQHVGNTLLNEPAPFTEVPWMWSDQYDLTIQAAGSALGDLEQVVRGRFDEPGGLVIFGVRDGRVCGVAGVSRGSGVGRVVRGALPLIEHAIAVTSEELADPSVDLRRLARERR